MTRAAPNMIASTLVKYSGPGLAEPSGIADQDQMADEPTRGRYGGAAKPIGRIHWAGAETSDIWNGYMDGAIRSGRRAAAEILTRTS